MDGHAAVISLRAVEKTKQSFICLHAYSLMLYKHIPLLIHSLLINNPKFISYEYQAFKLRKTFFFTVDCCAKNHISLRQPPCVPTCLVSLGHKLSCSFIPQTYLAKNTNIFLFMLQEIHILDYKTTPPPKIC
jgi:hypothetical protein